MVLKFWMGSSKHGATFLPFLHPSVHIYSYCSDDSKDDSGDDDEMSEYGE